MLILEHAREASGRLTKPVSIDGCDLGHVLFRRKYEFMVDDVGRRVCESP